LDLDSPITHEGILPLSKLTNLTFLNLGAGIKWKMLQNLTLENVKIKILEIK